MLQISSIWLWLDTTIKLLHHHYTSLFVISLITFIYMFFYCMLSDLQANWIDNQSLLYRWKLFTLTIRPPYTGCYTIVHFKIRIVQGPRVCNWCTKLHNMATVMTTCTDCYWLIGEAVNIPHIYDVNGDTSTPVEWYVGNITSQYGVVRLHYRLFIKIPTQIYAIFARTIQHIFEVNIFVL